jgi:hypothetical protein
MTLRDRAARPRSTNCCGSRRPYDVRDFTPLGIFVLCGLWQLSFPNSVIRFYERFCGSRFSPSPFSIRLTGGVWVALALYLWLSFSK